MALRWLIRALINQNAQFKGENNKKVFFLVLLKQQTNLLFNQTTFSGNLFYYFLLTDANDFIFKLDL